jgi:D-sedoheptulose 7-phosphate isomerase
LVAPARTAESDALLLEQAALANDNQIAPGAKSQALIIRIEDAQAILEESLKAHQALLNKGPATLVEMAQTLVKAFTLGRQLLIFGNGGSAADAQHLAAEFMGRFAKDRRPLPALALTTDSSVLTALSNDSSYEEVFAHQIRALGRPGDIALGISTSGNSENVARGLAEARSLGLRTLAFTGRAGRRVGQEAELCFCAPADSTARVQELHLLSLHLMTDLVERTLFPEAPRLSGH